MNTTQQGTGQPKQQYFRRSTDRVPVANALTVQNESEPRFATASSRRPAATFVAQLIATATHCPQTRNLRRADSEDADAIYRAAVSYRPVQAGTHARLIA